MAHVPRVSRRHRNRQGSGIRPLRDVLGKFSPILTHPPGKTLGADHPFQAVDDVVDLQQHSFRDAPGPRAEDEQAQAVLVEDAARGGQLHVGTQDIAFHAGRALVPVGDDAAVKGGALQGDVKMAGQLEVIVFSDGSKFTALE